MSELSEIVAVAPPSTRFVTATAPLPSQVETRLESLAEIVAEAFAETVTPPAAATTVRSIEADTLLRTSLWSINPK